MTRKETDVIRDRLSLELEAFAHVRRPNALCFTVRGWPFAILRNGSDAWDILHPGGLFEACPTEHLATSIAGFTADAEAENWQGWDADPPDAKDILR